QAVIPIAAKAGAGHRQRSRLGRHRLVKCGIGARDLRRPRIRLFARLDGRQRLRKMVRRQGNPLAQFPFGVGVQPARLGPIERRHDPVAHGLGRIVRQCASQRCGEIRRGVQARGLGFPNPLLAFKPRQLDTRRAGVERQNLHSPVYRAAEIRWSRAGARANSYMLSASPGRRRRQAKPASSSTPPPSSAHVPGSGVASSEPPLSMGVSNVGSLVSDPSESAGSKPMALPAPRSVPPVTSTSQFVSCLQVPLGQLKKSTVKKPLAVAPSWKLTLFKLNVVMVSALAVAAPTYSTSPAINPNHRPRFIFMHATFRPPWGILRAK